MHQSQIVRSMTLAVAASCLCFPLTALLAQEEDPNALQALGLLNSGPPRPIATVTLSGIENSLDDIAWMFDEADRSDMVDVINTFLTDKAGNLKGVDRTRPMGIMLFLQESLPPRPIPVAYVPVDNISDLIKTLDLGPLKPKKVDGTENRYELGGGRRSQHVLVRDGYLYMSRNEDYATREDLPIPADFTPPHTSKYDFAASIDLTSISPLLRDAFLGFLRSQAEAELQQRDNEPEGAYIVRRANGISGLEAIEELLRDGEKVTIGLDASKDKQLVTIDVTVDAKPGSKLAENAMAFDGRATAFGPLLEDESQPLTVAASFDLGKREQKVYLEYVRAMEAGLKEQFATADGGTLTTASSNMISRIVDPLRSTVENKHMDFCVQVRAVDAQTFVLVGGTRIVGGETLATGVQELLSRVGEVNDNAGEVELNIANHQGVNIHRLRGPEDRRGRDRGPFGTDPAVYLGAGGRTVWFSIGGPAALDELEAAMDRLVDGASSAPRASAPPFNVVFRTARWLKLPEDNPDEGREIAEETFRAQDDAVRLEVRPTDNGVKFRVQFERSFVRFIGSLLARQFDKTQL